MSGEDKVKGMSLVEYFKEKEKNKELPIDFEGIINGKVTVTPDNNSSRKEEITETATTSSFIGNAISYFLIVPGKVLNTVLSIVVYSFQDQDKHKVELLEPFTIQSLVMGEYTIFDIDLFSNSSNSKNPLSGLKQNISTWYVALRQIAIVISLLVLLYIGIRIAISSLASDKAKYKQMLTSWVTGFILLFVIHYIAIFAIETQKGLIELLSKAIEQNTATEEEIEASKNVGFEKDLMNNTWEKLEEAEGWNMAQYIIMYYVLLYYQIKFAYLYFRRTLTVGFLITISPLVTVTYALDKIGDSKAQAFGTWLKELIINIFMQVLHLAIYVIFIFSASEIALRVPYLGILFIMALSRAEKLVRKAFTSGGQGLGDVDILSKVFAK